MGADRDAISFSGPLGNLGERRIERGVERRALRRNEPYQCAVSRRRYGGIQRCSRRRFQVDRVGAAFALNRVRGVVNGCVNNRDCALLQDGIGRDGRGIADA